MISEITLITLGVEDMAKARDFYKGLGFEITCDEPGYIGFKTEGTKFALVPMANLANDANAGNPPEVVNGFTGLVLAHNTDSKEAVDDLYLKVQALGGSVQYAPRKAVEWNGYHFYFRDLDGHYWEIAY